MTPITYYQQLCAEGRILDDPDQRSAIEQLNILYLSLLKENKKRAHPFSLLRKPRLIKGLYLWGSVGIGKTLLMDCFFRCLPFEEKNRMHFHEFMRLIHKKLKHYQGKKDPLRFIARKISKKNNVLCLDELIVTDITDAMILGKLFKYLFSFGVCLVITSNTAPCHLYQNGLQREQFLPAIDLIESKTKVIYIPTLHDYRLRHLKKADVFYTPNNEQAHKKMENIFTLLTKEEAIETGNIQLNGRTVKIREKTKNIIWFDFNDICSIPRSQEDYLILSTQYDTVFISDVPKFNDEDSNSIYLFILMVDIFYDAHVKLILSAEENVDHLYKGNLKLEYARTRSRLIEMQSESYKEFLRNRF
ncbi:MAG: cell division protein ZapE [Gammaproteobacteria bacterium]|nr:cell division protein ZapE [Gammaproteobacteria bacterium]